MVLLKLLATVDAVLSEAKEKPDNNTAVSGGLAIVILMGDFYQFPPVVGRLLWETTIIIQEFLEKAISNYFTSVIILTEQIRQQIRQQNNKAFHNLLTSTKKRLLNIDNVDILKSRVASSIPINNVDKSVVIV